MPKPAPTFEEWAGIGRVPLSSYFKGTKPSSADTRFAPEARALLQQGEDYDQEQMAREAELAAESLLTEAPNLTDQQLQGELLNNPRIFGTQAARPLSGYMRYRQQVVPPSQADEVLGPQFLQKIEDPRHRERFQHRMLKENMSANDAFEEYRRDEYNDQFAEALAEAGVPDEEMDSLRTPTGLFDRTAVARRVARAKAEAKKGTGAVSTLDEEIELLRDAMKERADRLAAQDITLLKDATYLDYVARLERATAEKLAQLRGAAPAAASPEGGAPAGPAPSAFLKKFQETIQPKQ